MSILSMLQIPFINKCIDFTNLCTNYEMFWVYKLHLSRQLLLILEIPFINRCNIFFKVP